MSAQTINTEAEKRAAILAAVTLDSCGGNIAEQRIKYERLMSISDDEILDYVLKEYALAYRDYREGWPLNRNTLINSKEFIRRVGWHSELMMFILNVFRCFPEEGDDLEVIASNAQRYLANRKAERNEEITN